MSQDKSSPKRKKIVETLTRNIIDGKFSPGEKVDSIRNISKQFGVSASVAHEAMKELANKMLVESGGTSGFYVSENVPVLTSKKNRKSTTNPADEPISIYCVHHNDLVWRYPYSDYAKIQLKQTQHLLDMAERHPELCFGMEQAAVLKNVLALAPELEVKLKKMAESGHFEPTGGFAIQDMNMISGESFVRNLLLGKKYYRKTTGKDPVVACLTDAFGMSAQIPQVLSSCGYRYLIPGHIIGCFDVVPPCGPFRWYSPDGSSVIVHARQEAFITHFENFGMMPVLYSPENTIKNFVEMLKEQPAHALASYTTEEFLINESIFPIVENANRLPGRRLEFTNSQTYFDRVSSSAMPDYYGEFNPSFTGCYSTRINIKQKVRDAENQLFAYEMLAAAGEKLNNTEKNWENLILCQFHDAICGCCADKAFESVLEKMQKAQVDLPVPSDKAKKLRIFNPENRSGLQLIESPVIVEGRDCQKDGDMFYFTDELAPLSAAAAAAGTKTAGEKKQNKCFETKYFKVDFSSSFPIISNKDGKNVFGHENFAEILFRPDYGTMWTEHHPGPSVYCGRNHEKETVVSITSGPVFTKAVVKGEVLPAEPEFGNLGNHWTGFESLSYTKTFIFYNDLDYFKLKIDLDWKGKNTKIAVRFPTEIAPENANASYSIPFGTIDRKPYIEVPEEYASTLKRLGHYYDPDAAGRGDWPALDFVDYSDMTSGIAVANTGTPGHHIAGKNITVSLLRSGTKVRDGYMMPQEGSFSNGKHEFVFAFRAHRAGELEKAAELGRILNHPSIVLANGKTFDSLWNCNRRNIVLSAIYNDGNKTVLRAYETVGRQCDAVFSGSLAEKNWTETDMNGSIIHKTDPSKISFKPFEIKTFLIS